VEALAAHELLVALSGTIALVRDDGGDPDHLLFRVGPA
jgi:hypothetical protein